MMSRDFTAATGCKRHLMKLGLIAFGIFTADVSATLAADQTCEPPAFKSDGLAVADADSVDESQIIVFDSHAADPGLAFALSRLLLSPEALDALAGAHGMARSARYALPANNIMLVYRSA